jgi:hypothetical protein
MTTFEKIPDIDAMVEVDWEVGDRYDDAGDGYCFMHHAIGTTDAGYTFSATAIMVHGNLEEIEDVEYTGIE